MSAPFVYKARTYDFAFLAAQQPAFFSLSQPFFSVELDFSVFAFSFFLGVSWAVATVENPKATNASISIAFFISLRF